MRAVVQNRYGGPECLRLSDLPVPEPKNAQMRVKVLACAVNLSDWEYLTGSPFYARLIGGLTGPRNPVLGSDIVGIVDKLGPGVTEFAVGDRVVGDLVMVRGGFAEFACVPASDMCHVPDLLSDEVAACLPQAGGIAVAGTDGLQPGSRFLINGAGGGSGTMALQLAKAAKAHVTVVDNAVKIEWLKALGADDAMDYREQDFVRIGRQWDRILDMVATRGPVAIARSLAKGGVYQASGGSVNVLLSLLLGGIPYRIDDKKIGMLLVPAGRELTQKVLQMAVDNKICPHLEDVLPLASVPKALQRTGLGEVKGKLVIKP